MLDTVLNFSYIAGYIVAWSGLVAQIIHIFRHKKARDFSLLYLGGLVLAKLFALPRTLTSDYWVWWVQEGISTILTVLFVYGILKYRGNK